MSMSADRYTEKWWTDRQTDKWMDTQRHWQPTNVKIAWYEKLWRIKLIIFYMTKCKYWKINIIIMATIQTVCVCVVHLNKWACKQIRKLWERSGPFDQSLLTVTAKVNQAWDIPKPNYQVHLSKKETFMGNYQQVGYLIWWTSGQKWFMQFLPSQKNNQNCFSWRWNAINALAQDLCFHCWWGAA